MAEDKKAQDAVEHAKGRPSPPPAGPHANEHLTDREKTPGTGSLPESGTKETDAGPD